MNFVWKFGVFGVGNLTLPLLKKSRLVSTLEHLSNFYLVNLYVFILSILSLDLLLPIVETLPDSGPLIRRITISIDGWVDRS